MVHLLWIVLSSVMIHSGLVILSSSIIHSVIKKGSVYPPTATQLQGAVNTVPENGFCLHLLRILSSTPSQSDTTLLHPSRSLPDPELVPPKEATGEV